ncbi:hypothetical protein HDR58_03310 [bacterium]|nr:hypothetical protein [bacterium]
MINILFVCHGTTADSQELAVLVGQSAAFGTVGYYGFTTSEGVKNLLFQAYVELSSLAESVDEIIIYRIRHKSMRFQVQF